MLKKGLNVFILVLLFVMFTKETVAQIVSAGPFVGGVTDTGARIYVHTDSSRAFTLQYSIDSVFSNPHILSDSTRSRLFGSVIIPMTGLQANTTYYYRVLFDTLVDQKKGRFRTFPSTGSNMPLRIAVGSCNYSANDPLFQLINNFDPDLFIHLGDWNWPPATFGNDMMLYPDRRAASFVSRYQDQSMSKIIMPYMPVEYIYDDDFSWNDGEGHTYPVYSVSVDSLGHAHTLLQTDSMPPGIREGAIKAYFDHFPGYPAVDTSAGIYHKISLGNVDIFMLDLRNNRDARHDAFKYDSTTGKWSYQPAPHHSMMGEKQRAWLIDGLMHSNADWKIIGSSIIFNKNYDTLLNVGIRLQSVPFNLNGQEESGAVLASQMSYNWAGYPYDQDTIMALVKSKQLKNTLVISGDSHSNMIDDGANGGLPEMQASGFSAGNQGTLNYYIDKYTALLGYPPVKDILWNGGGNGIGNADTLNGFGTIEVYGQDSLKMCVYDQTGLTMGCKTLYHNIFNGEKELTEPSNVNIYPNPGNTSITVDYAGNNYAIKIFDLLGHMELEQRNLSGQTKITTSQLPAGAKIIEIRDAQGNDLTHKKWIKVQ